MGRKKYKQRRMIKNAWNDHFFDELTPDGGYIIGFLIADGALTDSDKVSSYAIRYIQNDVDILKRIAKVLEFSGKIYQYEGKSACLHMASRHASELLIHGYGIPPGRRKSYEVRIPRQIRDDDKILPHFIRGYFDGDGSIPTHGCSVMLVSGSLKLLEDCNEVMVQYVGLPQANIRHYIGGKGAFKKANGKPGSRYCIYWTGTSNMRKFAEYIYGPSLDVHGSALYLERKRERFLKNFDAPYKDGEWLKREFIEKKKSMETIADECGVSRSVIGKYIIQSYNFVPELKDYEWMYHNYIVEGKWRCTMAEELRVSLSAVNYWLKKLEIYKMAEMKLPQS